MDKYATLTVKQIKEKLAFYKVKGVSALKKEALLNKLFVVEFEQYISSLGIVDNRDKSLPESLTEIRKQRYISANDKRDMGLILGSIELTSALKLKNVDLSSFDGLDILWFHNRLNYEGQYSYLLLKCDNCLSLSEDKDKQLYLYVRFLVKENENEDIVITADEITEFSLSNILNKLNSEVISLYIEETEPIKDVVTNGNIVLESGVVVKMNDRFYKPRYIKNGNDYEVESKIKSYIIYTMLNYLYIENYTIFDSQSIDSQTTSIDYDSLTKLETIYWTHFEFNDSTKFNYILYKTNQVFTLLKFKYDLNSEGKKFTKTSVYLSYKLEDIILYGMNKQEYLLYEDETY